GVGANSAAVCGFFGLELTRPSTTAAAIAARSATASTSARRRDGVARRGSSASTRLRSGAGACGACARSRVSTVISFADIRDLLLQSFQCAAEPRRARGLADPEDARRARAVELEEDPQRDHFALRRRQLAKRLLEVRRQPVAELVDDVA